MSNGEMNRGSLRSSMFAPADRPPHGGSVRESEAVRHAEACAPRHAVRARSSARSAGATAWALALVVLGAGVLAMPDRCKADDDTPSIVGYAFQGFGTGLATGLALGYLATGPKWEKGEWRTLLWGGGIGALSGLGIGLVLGIVDAATVPDGRGVGFYIMRDSNLGYSVGALAGGIVGVLIWAGGGTSKDLALGLAWGTVIGAAAGIVLGVIEGSLRSRSSERASRNELQLGLGFTPTADGSLGTPYPSLIGRF